MQERKYSFYFEQKNTQTFHHENNIIMWRMNLLPKKYLGVSLDQTLTGKYIAEQEYCKKGKLYTQFLWRQAKYLNRNSRKLLATSLMLCHFDCRHTYKFEGLQVNLQKSYKFSKTKLGYPPPLCRSHIGIEDFIMLHWIPVYQRVKQRNYQLFFH